MHRMEPVFLTKADDGWLMLWSANIFWNRILWWSLKNFELKDKPFLEKFLETWVGQHAFDFENLFIPEPSYSAYFSVVLVQM